MKYEEYQSAFLNVEKKVRSENDAMSIFYQLLIEMSGLLFVNGVFSPLKWHQFGRIFKIAFTTVKIIGKIVDLFKTKK